MGEHGPPRMSAADDLRHRVCTVLHDRVQLVVDDANALFPHTLVQTLEADQSARLARLIAEQLARAVRDGRGDAHGGAGEVRALLAQRHLPLDAVFALVYLIERAAADQLAIDSA